MKRLLFSFILIVLLVGCGSDDPQITYDESDFIFEVNQEGIDLISYIESEHTLIFDLHDVDFGEVGEYSVTVTDVETEIDYVIPIVIEDTTAPKIHVPEDFKLVYDIGETLDISGISVTDNSMKDLTFTSNISEIDMDTVGSNSLILIAVDYSGNLRLVTLNIVVRNIVYPEIDINTYIISDNSFTVSFTEVDTQGYKVESFYRIVKGYEVVQQGELTDTFTFEVTELLPDTGYEISMSFTYQIPGEEPVTIDRSVFITTLE